MNLSLTTACNRRCAYCFQKGWYLTKEPQELPLDDAKEIVRRFSRGHVSLLGGEPLLYSRLSDLLSFLKETNVRVTLITNASTDNFSLLEPFVGNPITGWLLNTDYPKVQREVFLRNFRWLVSHPSRQNVCLSTTLLDSRESQTEALKRCLELREMFKSIRGGYRGLSFRISPYSPNPKGTFSVHNFDDDLFFFLGNLRCSGEIGINFDCVPNGCEISTDMQDYLKSRGIRFPDFACGSRSCPVDFLVDGSVIYCSSSPHIRVESWRDYQSLSEIVRELGDQRDAFMKETTGCSKDCRFYARCFKPCVSKVRFYSNRKL